MLHLARRARSDRRDPVLARRRVRAADAQRARARLHRLDRSRHHRRPRAADRLSRRSPRRRPGRARRPPIIGFPMPIYEYRRPDGTTFEIAAVLQRRRADGRPGHAACRSSACCTLPLFTSRAKASTTPTTARASGASARTLRPPKVLESSSRSSSSDRPRERPPRRRLRVTRRRAPPRARAKSEPAKSESGSRSGSTLGAAGRPLAPRAQPSMKRFDVAAALRFGDRQPVLAVRQRDRAGRLQDARRRRARDRQRRRTAPSSVGAAHVGDDRRRRVPGDPAAAARSSKATAAGIFIALNSACWCSSRWMSFSFGCAQVLPRARDRERLLAVDVVRARGQPQRVAPVARIPRRACEMMQPPV